MAESPAKEEVLHQIGRVCGSNYHRLRELLDELGLYKGQPPVLQALWEQEGMTQSELADKLERSPSTITKMVQRMERSGFLERRPDSDDERVSRVHLTEMGRKVQSDVEAILQAFAAEAFDGFTEEELASLYSMLKRIHHNVGE
jgi:DNA-binding MarR family transcriptional regulator